MVRSDEVLQAKTEMIDSMSSQLLLADHAELLAQFQEMVQQHFCSLGMLLNNPNVQTLATTYKTNLAKRNVDLGFNLFAIISDVYHRENLHSDILRSFL